MTMVTSIAAPAFADAYGIALYGTHYLDQGNITVEVRGGQYYVSDVLDDDGPVHLCFQHDHHLCGGR